MKAGAVLILAGMLIMMGGVVVRAQFVPEKPYLVSEPHLSQAQIYMNAFDNNGLDENGNTIWNYGGSEGFSIMIDDNENIGTLMLLFGDNILSQENNVWIWNTEVPEVLTISGDISSIERLGFRDWKVILSPITIGVGEESQTFENGIAKIELEYSEDAFRFDIDVIADEGELRFGTDLMYANAENIKIYVHFGEESENIPIWITNFASNNLTTTGQKYYYNYDITAEMREEVEENVFSATTKVDMYAVVVGFETMTSFIEEHKTDISTALLISGAMTMVLGVFVSSQERKRMGRWR